MSSVALENVDAKLLKKVIKEGGKKGVEIQGVSEMGGLEFFCTKMDEPAGNLNLLVRAMEAMNEPCAEDAEERKGGSGNVGKMIFSCDDNQLCIVSYVPEELADKINVKTWTEHICSMYSGSIVDTEKTVVTAVVLADKDAGRFPLKIRDEALTNAIKYLISKGAFPDDDGDDDSEDDMVFGDDFDPDQIEDA